MPLIKLVRGPHEFLADPGLKLNSIYYITKAIIPPLNRCLLLIGADASHWFADLPRKHILVPTTLPKVSLRSALMKGNQTKSAASTKKSTISQYFSTTSCPAECGAQTQTGALCSQCVAAPAQSATLLSEKIAKLDRKYAQLQRVCASCCGRPIADVACQSLDCPVLYMATSCGRQFEEAAYLRQVLCDNYP